jgi:membrane associated rhomboid family serine protease
MFYEYALISVIIASGYWGYYFLRHQPHGTLTFGMMQLTAAAMSGLGLLGRSYDHAILGVCGAIGLGMGACLLVVGPLVRGLARRFAAAERVTIASKLLDVAEVLAPGSGVAEEKALLAAMKEIREGRVEHTVDALTAAKHHAPAEAKVAIDERIAMLYLAAYRWRDGVDYAERHLMPAAQPRPGGMSLRDALGIAPPVWIELLGAYGRLGDLDQAAKMMARLEEACRGREDASLWLHRGRMMFLALAGRPDSVKTLVEPRRSRHMTAAARTYWLAVALQHHGDREQASAAFQRARSRSRGRPRELIDEAIARLSVTEAVQLSPEATEVVAKVEASPPPGPIHLPLPRAPWATYVLTASVLGTAALIAWLVGPSSDPGVLVRSGAMVRGRVDDGEWWRLVSAVFVHVGTVHLIVNVIGIYFLGKVLEEIFGTARSIAIYLGAGIAGAFASYLMSPVGVSAGASGAIFGVLGAVFIELTLHRSRYRAAWKRGMWGGLVVVTLAQAGIGFLYPVIDQWAHGAGLVAGIVLGAALSPSVRWAKATSIAGTVLAIAFGAVTIITAVQIARTSLEDSLARTPRRSYQLDTVTLTAPEGWLVARPNELVDPDNLVIVVAGRTPTFNPAVSLEEWVTYSEKEAKARDFSRLDPAPDRLVLPAGWQGKEMLGSVDDAMGHTLQWRLVIGAKQVGEAELALVRLYLPDTMAKHAPAFFASMIDSITLR